MAAITHKAANEVPFVATDKHVCRQKFHYLKYNCTHNTNYFYNYTGEISGDLPPDPKKQKEDPCVEFVTNLRQVYRTAQPPTWDPLPQCSHVKLAMIKRKGKQYECETKTTAESRVRGDVDRALTEKVPVDFDKIFDAGTFDSDRQVLLVEGVGGMGKTSLAYQYAKKWAEGSFSVFDAVVLVRLRDLNEHDVCEVDRILPHLLFLASGNKIPTEMARLLFSELKALLILDGWDESPTMIRNPSFVKSLQSVSSQTKVLITSRPDFSLNLHNLANRVEILGFTKNDIHSYFKAALESQLSSDSEVKLACDRLSSHFHHRPEIESCCYVPLNAVILAYIYLYRNQTLPITRCELFQELVLCCIVRELKTRQPDSALEDVSSFEDLPADLKEQLRKLSELAYKGVIENNIVFSQKELTSLSTLGLLHSVQGFGSFGRKLVTCNFIHLAVQELLAAYCISQLEPAEHSKQFINLLQINRMFPVLQFYSGLTRLANEGVRNLIINEFQSCGQTFGRQWHSNLLVIINCIFEAQMIIDQAFYEQITNMHRLEMNFNSIFLTPMDCLSLQYFLSSVGRMKKGNILINLDSCSLNDHSISLLLGISPEQTLSTSVVLQSLDTFSVMGNTYTDSGLIHFVKALDLTSISTLKTLKIGNGIVTDKGIEPLLESLSRQNSLEELELHWSSPHDDKSLEKIGEYAKRMSKLKKLVLFPNASCTCKQFTSEETKQWIQSLMDGGNSLMYSLESSMVEQLVMHIHFNIKSMYAYRKQVISSLNETEYKINIEREKTNLPHFNFDSQVLIPFGADRF